MLGIEHYGSDSDSENTTTVAQQPQRTIKPKPKKIAIGLPSLPKSTDKEDVDTDEGGYDERPAKRMKTASSLLSMLPKPKQTSSFTLPPPKSQFNLQSRVLGGGASREHALGVAANEAEESSHLSAEDHVENDNSSSFEAPAMKLFMPSSLGKGKKNISLEEGPSQTHPTPAMPVTRPTAPAVDFFSLESTSSTSKPPSTATSLTTPSISISVPSAAPDLPKFEPPEPAPTDPYPGYYQLPSGQWAAHDVEYYNKFLTKWQKEYNAHLRSLEKGTVKGFEGLRDSSIEEVNALKEMEKARKEIQEREEKKAITTEKGEPAKPRMNINASKMSGVARSRHQLSTLLKEAYENREALEERIAQGKRNRKEAGNKYGF